MTDHLAEFEGGPFHNQIRAISVTGDEAPAIFIVQTEEPVLGPQGTEVVAVTEHVYVRNAKPALAGFASTTWKYVYHGVRQ